MSAEPFILWSLRASDRHCLHPAAMARRTIALLAMAVAVVSGQEVPNAPATPQESPAAPVPAAPVPAAPVPAAPVPAAPVTPIIEPPEELTGGALVAFTRNEYLEVLAKEGIPASRGCWLYGDYLNDIPGVNDPVSCAQACSLDEKCFHWNFKFMMKRCDLKAYNGGINQDIGDWITGDAARYSNPPAVIVP